MNNHSIFRTFASVASLCLGLSAFAHAPSGAIFTTLSDGSEVNFNQYPSKEAVYLDGGPGPGAPQHAAGLDDGTYVFQVTDPSGKVLLSTDVARARQFTVANGVISGVVPNPGQHLTGVDIDHNATTVQLMPYNDTPNNGGVYKVWVTRVEDYLLGCQELGVANGLDVVDPGQKGGNRHGFIPAHSKTDNFKVKKSAIIEIDTRFYNAATGEILDGLGVTWTDTLGASNKKFSYYAPNLMVFHEAHVEAVEPGVHAINIENGPGYTVNHVHLPDGTVVNGPTTVYVNIPNNTRKDLTIFIDVEVDLQ
ncbi:MAG TPA: hypothetical protein VF773_00425 [Verrucomicrobiae bacterium]